MGHQMDDIAGLELMEQRHHDRPVGQRAQKCHGPLGGVAGAEGDPVARLQADGLI